ncbi:hypothetical protein LOZ61_005678 [Ophidiomyces ophidiicola]|nr:hypothetical protein LOZ61_005678 [Ophidiomyces ophidiicola]KAI1931667.1 hypothetical protein LOZ60_000202 [Ophidiomyces ophidiicola]KAI2138494.1 hypothetical protein LOZ27_005513 [Ophidiomyces ophidiicola]KAI2412711.1 hypothetical protein LOY90_001865 [Ophidiomyces ophidiicola]
MASIENYSSGRKLKTYGRASRSIGYSPLLRPGSERGDHCQVLSSTKEESGRVEQCEVYNKGVTETPRKLSQTTYSKPLKPTTTGKQTPITKIGHDVYDIPSSDDELRNRMDARKRRKLEAPKDRWKSPVVNRVVPNPITLPRASDRMLKKPKSSIKNSNQGNTIKAPGVDVVIKTPPSAKAKGFSKLWQRQARNCSSTKPPGKLFQRELDRTLHRRDLSASSATKPPIPPQLSRTPSQKLKEMTEYLSLESPYTLPLKRTLSSENYFSPTCGAEISVTPSRTRLMDALNTRESESSDNSSDSDTGLRQDQLRNSSGNSQASSTAPTTVDSESCVSPASRHPRRRPASQAAHQLQQNGLRVTYARQRSFLTENDLNSNLTGYSNPASNSQDDPLLDFATSLLPPKLETNLQDPDEGNDMGVGSIRSIYELRRAGGNARYQAVTESIFEDLEDKTSSTSRRRSGFMQLCSKLIDVDFARRFVSGSLEKRLSRCTAKERDIICNFLAVCIYTILLTSAPNSPVTLHTCFTQIIHAAISLIPESRDISELAKLRESNMTKAGQSSLQDLHSQLRQSKMWSDLTSARLSPQNVALRSLEVAVRKMREGGDQTAKIPSSVLARVVGLLLQHSQDGAKGDLFILEITFSILESYTVGLPSLDGEEEKILQSLSRLGSLLAQLIERSDAPSRQIQILQIRLILNITNNNPSLCEDFATSDLIGALARLVLSNFGAVAEDLASSEKKESLLDTVILALGTLINLTEWSRTSRQLFLRMKHGSTVLVDGLTELFVEGLETISEADSVVQTHSNVAFGYLSVLLSTLCLEDDVRNQVRSQMRGNNIGRLLSIVDEFLHYYRKVDEELDGPVLEEDTVSDFTARLQSIVDRIREVEGLRR